MSLWSLNDCRHLECDVLQLVSPLTFTTTFYLVYTPFMWYQNRGATNKAWGRYAPLVVVTSPV